MESHDLGDLEDDSESPAHDTHPKHDRILRNVEQALLHQMETTKSEWNKDEQDTFPERSRFQKVKYEVESLRSPRLTGTKLKICSKALRSPIRKPLLSFIRKQTQVQKVRELACKIDSLPTYYPVNVPSKEKLALHERKRRTFDLNNIQKDEGNQEGTEPLFRFWNAHDFTLKYKNGELTPTDVAKALIELVHNSNEMKPPLKAVIAIHPDDVLRQAAASTERYSMQRPLSLLDGVPIAVKDALDVVGYCTSLGASVFSKNEEQEKDSAPISKLRAAGAIIIGKTNLHEFGLGTTGYNSFFGTTRNPYCMKNYAGGSSSGSAAAVAAGLVPIAIGTDSGGSIRIPAGLCGVVGLKPTFKRIKMNFDSAPSVSNVGPIAGSVRDAALVYAIMAEDDEDDDIHKRFHPAVHVADFLNSDLSDIRIGVYWSLFNDSDPAVAEICHRTLQQLSEYGAKIVEIAIPHVHEINIAHHITVLTEVVQSMDGIYRRVSDFSKEVQISIEVGRSMSAMDFLAAQRVRAYAMKKLEKIFKEVDVIITPTTPYTAPEIGSDSFSAGESDMAQTCTLMKFMSLANFTGIPAISIPVGNHPNGLPVSMQLQSSHWNEHILLRIANCTESIFHSIRRKPESFFSLIDDSKQRKKAASSDEATVSNSLAEILSVYF